MVRLGFVFGVLMLTILSMRLVAWSAGHVKTESYKCEVDTNPVYAKKPDLTRRYFYQYNIKRTYMPSVYPGIYEWKNDTVARVLMSKKR